MKTLPTGCRHKQEGLCQPPNRSVTVQRPLRLIHAAAEFATRGCHAFAARIRGRRSTARMRRRREGISHLADVLSTFELIRSIGCGAGRRVAGAGVPPKRLPEKCHQSSRKSGINKRRQRPGATKDARAARADQRIGTPVAPRSRGRSCPRAWWIAGVDPAREDKTALMQRLRPGDRIVHRVRKGPACPGPRTQDVRPSPHGKDSVYGVDRFWTVTAVRTNGDVVAQTRRGKRRVLRPDDPAMGRATWLDRPLRGSRFSTCQEAAGRSRAAVGGM
jgi:hypothetical protein